MDQPRGRQAGKGKSEGGGGPSASGQGEMNATKKGRTRGGESSRDWAGKYKRIVNREMAALGKEGKWWKKRAYLMGGEGKVRTYEPPIFPVLLSYRRIGEGGGQEKRRRGPEEKRMQHGVAFIPNPENVGGKLWPMGGGTRFCLKKYSRRGNEEKKKPNVKRRAESSHKQVASLGQN